MNQYLYRYLNHEIKMKDKRSVIVSLGGHKGGIGKSFLSNLLALYIKEKTDYSVVVVDADDKQNSIDSRRKFDLRINEGLKEEDLYDIVVYPSLTAGKNIIANEMGLYDIIIVDFPGNLNAEGVKTVYNLVDLIFIPIDPISFVEVQSIIKFCSMMIKEVDPLREQNNFDPAERYFIFNKVNRAVKEFRNNENTKALKEDVPFPVLDNMVPEWKVFKEEFQTVSYFNEEVEKRQRVIDGIAGEMFEKVENLFKKLNS